MRVELKAEEEVSRKGGALLPAALLAASCAHVTPGALRAAEGGAGPARVGTCFELSFYEWSVPWSQTVPLWTSGTSVKRVPGVRGLVYSYGNKVFLCWKLISPQRC